MRKNEICMWLVFQAHMQPAGSYWSPGEGVVVILGAQNGNAKLQLTSSNMRRHLISVCAWRFTCAEPFHVLILTYIHGLYICYAYVWKCSHAKIHSPLFVELFAGTTQSTGVVLVKKTGPAAFIPG